MSYADIIASLTDSLIFEEKLEVSLQLAQREGWHGALLYLELDPSDASAEKDDAKEELLSQLHARLEEETRGGDLLLQLEEDDFLIWLQHVDAEQSLRIATRIGERLRHPFSAQDVTVTFEIHIGIALYPFDGTALENLKTRALEAVYQGKKRGRMVHIYDPLGDEAD